MMNLEEKYIMLREFVEQKHVKIAKEAKDW